MRNKTRELSPLEIHNLPTLPDKNQVNVQDQLNQIISAIEKNTALLSALLSALDDDDEPDITEQYLSGKPLR